MKLKDRVALVTGSSRGIGRATALLFAKEGAKVVVNYNKSEKEANEVVDEIKKFGSDAIAIKCDVSDEKQVKAMVDKSINKFGKIDILVNNAGIVFDVPFSERTVEQWKRTLNVNLIGVFLCSRHVAKHMLKQKYGKIINISSTGGFAEYHPESVDYNASKAGVINLTKTLAVEFAPTINVNSIAPGWVDTEMNKDLSKEFIKEQSERACLKRFAQPEEIAATALFLASNDSSYITGEVIVVDGGYTLK